MLRPVYLHGDCQKCFIRHMHNLYKFYYKIFYTYIYINIMVKMKVTNYDIIIRVFSEEGVNGR